MNEVSAEQELAEIQNKIVEAEDNLNTVQLEKYRIKKELVELTESERKAKYVLSKLKVQEKIKTREFWKERNG